MEDRDDDDDFFVEGDEFAAKTFEWSGNSSQQTEDSLLATDADVHLWKFVEKFLVKLNRKAKVSYNSHAFQNADVWSKHSYRPSAMGNSRILQNCGTICLINPCAAAFRSKSKI
jgi:hypothetical protein